MILKATKAHAASIATIYNEYILNSIYTFELEPVDEKEISKRIASQHIISWIVYIDREKVLGYAYASKWKDRAAYEHTAEISVYLNREYTGRNLGPLLYHQLFEKLKTLKFKVIIAGIALPNPVSIIFHERLGFQKVAHFEKVGYKFGNWIDVAYWQLMLKI